MAFEQVCRSPGGGEGSQLSFACWPAPFSAPHASRRSLRFTELLSQKVTDHSHCRVLTGTQAQSRFGAKPSGSVDIFSVYRDRQRRVRRYAPLLSTVLGKKQHANSERSLGAMSRLFFFWYHLDGRNWNDNFLALIYFFPRCYSDKKIIVWM